MPEIIRDIEQGSPEWLLLRLGSVGGTGINSVLAKGQGKSRKTYLYKLAGEILTGQQSNEYHAKQFDRGHEWEPVARSWYEFTYDVEVEQVAMIRSPGIRRHHSPDGLVGEDGGIEIKTREPHIYLELVETGKMPIADIRQCQNFLDISGRAWIDYVVYCVPEMPSCPAWVKRIKPDPDMFEEMHKELLSFLKDLNELVGRMQ